MTAPPAFYALPPGGWRDYLTLLHPPYTAWHLSHVCLGWASAPVVHLDRLVALLVAFFLAVGVAAHALDELNGRPLRTRIPAPVLRVSASTSIALAMAIGVVGASRTSWWLLVFVVVGGFIVVAYNLELFGGRFHTDLWFALAWGAFPALTASWANTLGPSLAGLVVAAGCAAASAAQRSLSTPVRRLRRATERVDGVIERNDGSVEIVDAAYLRRAPERALRALSVALPALGLAAVLARL